MDSLNLIVLGASIPALAFFLRKAYVLFREERMSQAAYNRLREYRHGR